MQGIVKINPRHWLSFCHKTARNGKTRSWWCIAQPNQQKINWTWRKKRHFNNIIYLDLWHCQGEQHSITSAYGSFGGVWNHQMQQQVDVMSIPQAGMSFSNWGFCRWNHKYPCWCRFNSNSLSPKHWSSASAGSTATVITHRTTGLHNLKTVGMWFSLTFF